MVHNIIHGIDALGAIRIPVAVLSELEAVGNAEAIPDAVALG